jgi:hypothetical protein
MRFLMQLSIRDDQPWTARNLKRGNGGVREALWDSRQTVAAQAMTLLAATETLRALEALDALGAAR